MYKTQADAVKEWLRAYVSNEEHIDQLFERLRSIEAQMMSVGAQKLSDMPRAPGNQRDQMAEYVIRKENIELELQWRIKTQNQCKAVIEGLLKELEKKEEQLIIRYRYLCGYEWNEVMMKVYGGNEKFAQKQEAYRRKMYRVHSDALEDMAKLWEKTWFSQNKE